MKKSRVRPNEVMTGFASGASLGPKSGSEDRSVTPGREGQDPVRKFGLFSPSIGSGEQHLRTVLQPEYLR